MLYIIDGTDEHEDQIGYSADNTNWSYIYKTKVFQIIDHKTYVRLQLEGGDDFNIEVNLVTNQLTWHTGSGGTQQAIDDISTWIQNSIEYAIPMSWLDTDPYLIADSDVKVPSQKAVKTYADALVVGLLDDRGNYNASTNLWPSSGGSGSGGAIKKGDLWYISVAGTLGGTAASVGSSIRALVDTPGQTAGNWDILNAGIGYVPENVANKDINPLLGTSDIKYPSQNAVKTYVDATSSSFVPVTRTVIGNNGIAGGGALSSNVVLVPTYGTTTNTICQGDDSRLSNSRTPTTHKSTHVVGGSDAFVKGDILLAAVRYLESISDPAADTLRQWLSTSDNKSLKYWDNQGTPVKQTIEIQSNKSVANGYAGLDSSTKLVSGQIPFGFLANTVAQGNDQRFFDFGDGEDGSPGSAPTTLSQTMHYIDLHVGSSTSLNVSGYKLLCNGNLTIDSGSTIHRNGNAGTGASGSTPGTGGAPLSPVELGNSSAGTNGATGVSGNGVASGVPNTVIGMGGAGAQGGTGGSGTGGSTAAAGAGGSLTYRPIRYVTNQLLVGSNLVNGGAGGSGGSSGVGGGGVGGPGGGGGGGGGVVMIMANHITNNGTISCKGGNGGNGGNAIGSSAGGGGGGAGGGGGLVFIICNTYGGNNPTCAGGTGGTGGTGNGGGGTGGTGSTGTAGRWLIYQYSTGSWTSGQS